MRRGKTTAMGLFLGLAALAFWFTGLGTAYAQALPGGTLDPTSIQKYQWELVKPPVMPTTSTAGGIDYYEIAVRQFTQQVVYPALIGGGAVPATTVWSYGSVTTAGTFNYPAFTIEAAYNRPVRVKWINDLKDGSGNFRPHLLPVDQTLHWTNPPGGATDRDSRPIFVATPGPYTGPVPLVTHVHGAHVGEESDGFAEAWYLPAAGNIPGGFATTGTFYDYFRNKYVADPNTPWVAGWPETGGFAIFQYPNNQRATTLWYHDHSLGMTRLNVYAGPAGFYLIRGGPDDVVLDKKDGGAAVLPGPAPVVGSNPFGNFREIPIAIQDRSFNDDGSLFYPSSREFFDGYSGPFIPDSDVSPIWNPEFFGNTMVVNGRTWPFLNVEQRRYRFRFLNGCNSRFLILRLATDANATAGIDDGVYTQVLNAFSQIGAEGGFLPKNADQSELLMGLAERADTIIDFGKFPVGAVLYLVNVGPDAPFGGGVLGVDFFASDPGTTGQVMQFRVVAKTAKDNSTPPGRLKLPTITNLGAPSFTRRVSLNEMMSMEAFGGPIAALLGTMESAPTDPPGSPGSPVAKMWDNPISENPAVGATEIWEIYNFTADAHPIHLHQVMFQVVNRENLVLDALGAPLVPVVLAGLPMPPNAWEKGFKDTVIAYPGQVTRIKARFDLPGLFVWHCHIVEHEDNEMMRAFHVGPIPAAISDEFML